MPSILMLPVRRCAGAPVDLDFRLVEAVHPVARGDLFWRHLQVVQGSPAVTAAAVCRRYELAGQVNASFVAVQLYLDFGVKALCAVIDIGLRYKLVAIGVSDISWRYAVEHLV